MFWLKIFKTQILILCRNNIFKMLQFLYKVDSKKSDLLTFSITIQIYIIIKKYCWRSEIN